MPHEITWFDRNPRQVGPVPTTVAHLSTLNAYEAVVKYLYGDALISYDHLLHVFFLSRNHYY